MLPILEEKSFQQINLIGKIYSRNYLDLSLKNIDRGNFYMNISGKNIEISKKILALAEEQKAGRGAGISAAIIIDGELVSACAAGVRGFDNSQADVEDLYNVGSVSKVYAAVAIMKLVEMGKINLDEPVYKYLPKFTMRDPRYKDITIRMTLCHTSGLPGTNYRNAIRSYWDDNDDYLEPFYEYWEDSKLKAAPGEFSVYCNDGFELAVAVLEAVSEKSYFEFLKEMIIDPVGARTTGIGKASIWDRKMMSCIDKKPEFVAAVGAGGIRTSIEDCARFGYMFLEPQGIFNKESISELSKAQGVTFLEEDNFSANYGLGWDTVEFMNPSVDLGVHTLGKGGGTLQFGSYLIVSPKYNLSAAISCANDCGVMGVNLLSEMVYLTLNELGILNERPKSEEPSLSVIDPEDWIEKYGKIYYSAMGINKPEIKDGKISFYTYSGENVWTPNPLLQDMQWDGQKLFSSSASLKITDYSEIKYAIASMLGMVVPFAQSTPVGITMSSGWKNRIGKKYIACNLSAKEENVELNIAKIIEDIEGKGIISFITPGGGQSILSAISCGDDDTDMFMNIPGMGSRDIYAPFIEKKEGVEYLRIGTLLYKDINAVSDLKTMSISIPVKEQNAVYRLKTGMKIEFAKPQDVEFYMLDDKLKVIYSSKSGEIMPEVVDGFIIFANDGPTNLEVRIR